MNRQFLNDVKFEKDVKIKRPKKAPTENQLIREKEARRRKRFNQKLKRLVFFLLTIGALWYVSILSCEGFMSMSAGRPVKIQDMIGTFMDGFNED